MELASMATIMATGPSLLQSRCSLKAHPPFQMLCDGRAAPLQQEDDFIRGHGRVMSPSWPVPSPPPPAIKLCLSASSCPMWSWSGLEIT